MCGRQSVDGERFSKDFNNAWNIGILVAQDHGVVDFNQVAQISINKGRLLNVLYNRQPTKPTKESTKYCQYNYNITKCLKLFPEDENGTE
jgi:hypothetical protein